MKQMLIREGAWVVVNMVAATVFLWLSSRTWIEPVLWNRSGAPGGDPAAFGVLVVKGLGPLLLFNVAWLAYAAWRCLPRRDWAPVWTFTGLGFLWTGLLVFSASRVGS
jgi:hypothetical protein